MNIDDQEAISAIIDGIWEPKLESHYACKLECICRRFLPGASLYPAARPVTPQRPEDFVERMKGLAISKLRSFEEAALGYEIRVFGNVALAVAVCQITENETQVTRGIEMMLLVKTEGRWQIVSQAWDTENESKPIPVDLLASS